jgi:S1-C subfamily serine protease
VAVNGREGAALFRLDADVGTEPLPTADSLHAGAWLAAVTLDEDHDLQVTPGHLASTAAPGAQRLDVAIAFPRSLEVAAVVDLDARLVGVALRSPDGVRVIPAQAARNLVDRLVSNPACRAIGVAPLTDPVRGALRLNGGVVVARLDRRAFATPPDLRPGDVILQLGSHRLGTPDDFVEAWDGQEPGARVRFLIARGGRRIVRRAEWPGRDCRPDSATPREVPLLGAVVQWTDGRETAGATPAGFRLLHVPADSRAAAAGMVSGDILGAVDGTPLTWPDARRLLAPWKGRRVPVLTVHRGDVTALLVLPEETDEPQESGE